MSEHFCESTIRASNTSKSVFFTWIMLLTVPSWLVTTGYRETGCVINSCQIFCPEEALSCLLFQPDNILIKYYLLQPKLQNSLHTVAIPVYNTYEHKTYNSMKPLKFNMSWQHWSSDFYGQTRVILVLLKRTYYDHFIHGVVQNRLICFNVLKRHYFSHYFLRLILCSIHPLSDTLRQQCMLPEKLIESLKCGSLQNLLTRQPIEYKYWHLFGHTCMGCPGSTKGGTSNN